MYGYIYRTTNLINGKIYIGQKMSSEFCSWYKGSGRVLKLAIEKYGWDNFSVEMLCPCFSKEELNAEERLLIAYFNSRDRSVGYNISEGGDWGDISGGMTAEEYQSWNLHKSEGMKGKSFTEEHRLHISLSTRGSNNHCYGQRGPESHNYGKRWPDRTFNRVCAICNSSFISRSNRAKYCNECLRSMKKPKNPNRLFHLVCKKCGGEFISYTNNRFYCSQCSPRRWEIETK